MILKTPAEKLPLTTRKNVRDEFEAKRPEYESTMKEILGESWIIEVNPNLVYEYASDDYKPRIGSVITWYFDALMYNLKRFSESYGDDGVQELNSVCSKHQICLLPQTNTKFTYGGLVVSADEGGTLHLVFAESNLGVNVDDISRDIATALKNAPPSSTSNGDDGAMNLVARNAVRADYDSGIAAVHDSLKTQLNMPDLALNPNFSANAAQLAKSKQHVDQGWDTRIGFVTLSYFEALRYTVAQHKFEGDDMQQEAFQEGVAKGEVCLRIVPKLQGKESRYNEVVIEDGGVLYLQTTLDNWGVNVDGVARRLLDIL